MKIFNRTEKKYLINENQLRDFLKETGSRIKKDRYYESDIHTIYFDTGNFELIRKSVEKPEFKEKLRVRSYGPPENENGMVFVEFKRKLNGTVYKRRSEIEYREIFNDIQSWNMTDKQIEAEVKESDIKYRKLKPKFYINCTRLSYIGDDTVRLTVDSNLCYRADNLKLKKTGSEKPITDKCVLEIKAEGAFPLWLSEALEKCRIYPQSFSKVGTAFQKEIKENEYFRNNFYRTV